MSLSSFEGASGQHYDYWSLNLKSREAFPMSGGNYLFTRPSGKGPEIVCAGETDSIWIDFVSKPLWDVAKKKHGATAAYVRLNPDPRARQLERQDLIEKHRPPMNADLLGEQAS
jgi:hypothetical protein